MKIRSLLTIGVLGMSFSYVSSVLAAEDLTYTCSHNGAKRIIRVEYQRADAPVPCKVTYQKGDAEKKEVWGAEQQVGYCEDKALAFVEKQRTWGWSCE